MSASRFIAQGIGFSPGSVKFIPTLGLGTELATGPSRLILLTGRPEQWLLTGRDDTKIKITGRDDRKEKLDAT